MEKEINQLIQDCILFFSNNCYTQNRIDKYRSLWRNGILRYMNINSIIFQVSLFSFFLLFSYSRYIRVALNFKVGFCTAKLKFVGYLPNWNKGDVGSFDRKGKF